MERNVTELPIDYLRPEACCVSSNHGPTPIEIQRWDDNGGAIPPDLKLRRKRPSWLFHEEPSELVTAE
jgi:hypothetical protein